MTFDRTTDEQCPGDEAFDALMRGELTTSERGAFHAHVDRCRPCQLLLRELASSIDVEAQLEGSGTSMYRLETRLGQGGMGVVYRATDVQLGRSVALKLPPRNEPDDRDDRSAGAESSTVSWLEARFLREALLTARLQHPGIVPIHQVGRWPSGDVFYTMKLISGRSLQELIGAARDLDERLALLPHVLAAADAVGYAHAQGVIHRDLKPANIMCGPFGETVVIDWGLAKQLDAGVSEVEAEIDERARLMTSPGLVLGTPSYMAPEQARGGPTDARADVFALGMIVYHLLAGAVAAPDLMAPARKPTGAPPDLIALVRKATAASPGDRYATAKQLADDLRRFQTGQLVGARVYSRSTLVWRWLVRHRSPVLLALLFVGVLVGSSLFSVRRIVREQQAATASRNELAVLQARSAMADDPTAALGWLKLADGPTVDWPTVRAIAEDALGRGVARHVLRGHGGPVGVVAIAPGGEYVASSGRDGAVWLWSRSTGQGWMVLYHPGHGNIAFSADGAILAASGRNGVKLYWPATGAQCALREPAGNVTALAIGPDPRSVVLGGADGRVGLWRCDGSAMRVLGSHAGPINAIALSRRGDVIATAGADGAIMLWTLATGESRALRGHAGEVNTVAFRGDGGTLASGGADATVRIWDLATGDARILRHRQMVHDVKFSPSGATLASAGTDLEVALWDLATGDRRTLPWDQVPWVIAFSPSGDRLAAAGLAGQVRIWDIEGGASWDLRGHKGAVYDVVFAPDGAVVTAGEDGSVRVWEHPQPSASRSEVHPTGAYVFAMSADGGAIALGGIAKDPLVRLRSGDGTERIVGRRTGGVLRVALSADGRRIAATGTTDRTAALWDHRTGEPTELRGHDEPVEDLAFSPDGALLATASLDGTVRLWETGSGRARTLRGHDSWVYSIAFSPDGKQLVSGGRDGTVRLWDLATGNGRILLRHPGQVRVVEFSRDGKLVASGDLMSGVGIVTLATGSARLLAGHSAWVYDVTFSPDGRQLVSGSADGTVRLWTAPWTTSQVLTRHDGAVRMVRFSPDGTTVASAGNDATVRVASVASGATRVLRGHTSKVHRVAFLPDGAHLLSSDGGGTLIRWSAPSLTDSPPSAGPLVAAWLAHLTSAAIEGSRGLSTPLSAPTAAGPERP
jgi:WD40 repeat protein